MARTTVRHTARALGKTLGLGSASAIVAASGVLMVGSGPAAAAPLPPNCSADAAVVTCFFSYNGTDGTNGSVQQFVVPSGVTKVTIEAWGAQGGNADGGQALGGAGGYSEGTVAVVPHATLDVTVGGQPTGTIGGFNGGGATGAPQSAYSTGAGGGATDVRLGGHTLAHRIVVAGGGGGGAYDSYLGGLGGPYSASFQSQGGAGGGSSGTEGALCFESGPWPSCGGAGSSSAGGTAGPSMSPCTRAGKSGIGGTGCGGGGGGGFYGGGGGGYFDGTLACCNYIGPVPVDSPGGGGSGYVTPSATGATTQTGLQFGNGDVRISYVTRHASRADVDFTPDDRLHGWDIVRHLVPDQDLLRGRGLGGERGHRPSRHVVGLRPRGRSGKRLHGRVVLQRAVLCRRRHHFRQLRLRSGSRRHLQGRCLVVQHECVGGSGRDPGGGVVCQGHRGVHRGGMDLGGPRGRHGERDVRRQHMDRVRRWVRLREHR